MAFRVVKNGPGRMPFASSWLDAQEPMAPNLLYGTLQFRNLQEHNCLVSRRIRFGTFAFQTQKAALGLKFRMVPRHFLGQLQAQGVAIEPLCAVQVVKIKFEPSETQLPL